MEQYLIVGILAAMLLVVIVGLLADIALITITLKANERKLKDFMLVDYYKMKYPLVNETFMVKSQEAQLIENNQEIHELNKRVTDIEDNLTGFADKLEAILKKVSNNVQRVGLADMKNNTM